MSLNSKLSRRSLLAGSGALLSAAPFVGLVASDNSGLTSSTVSTTDSVIPVDLNARLDAEHLASLGQLPPIDLTDINAARQLLSQFPSLDLPTDVSIEDFYTAATDGHQILLRVYRPQNLVTPAPALYWIHGGGLVLGDVAQDDFYCANLARELGIMVISVEYRLAPDFPYPTPILDCYSGLLWVETMMETLGIDPERLAIGGASAGGGLTAALALGVRDLGGPKLCLQFLVYPMLDDRNVTHSSYAITDPRVWNRTSNLIGWESYLPGLAGGDDVPHYASAARATDLSNLPPAYINVGEFDLFLDEDVDYAQRLLRSGVATELHVYPGAFHGSNSFVQSALSQRWVEDEHAALRRAFKLV